jgi:hypothetical protein
MNLVHSRRSRTACTVAHRFECRHLCYTYNKNVGAVTGSMLGGDLGRVGGLSGVWAVCYKTGYKEVAPMPLEGFVVQFVQLVVAPFTSLDRIWLGIIPLYVSMILGEVYIQKVSYANAVRNGFLMLWAGLNWAANLANSSAFAYVFSPSTKIIAWIVTGTCLSIAIFTIVLGLRKKDKELAGILGHTRFSGYFLIMLYPMQAGLVRWTWPHLATILVFALPAWFVIYLLGRLARIAVK